MNQLPSLPLINDKDFGPSLFVDNTWLERLQTCSRAHQYENLNKRKGAAENAALNFGSGQHLAWDWRYSTLGNQAVDPVDEEKQVDILTKFYIDNPPPLDDFRNLGHAIECQRQYNRRYQTEPFDILADEENKPMVEKPFALHLYTHKLKASDVIINAGELLGDLDEIPIIYTGKIDLVLKWDEQTWVMDHKTASQLGDYFFQDKFASSQLPGYCWAIEQTTNLKPVGYAINALRSKAPPAKLSTASASQINAWWDESLARDRQYLKTGQLDEWKNNAIELVERFFYHYSRGYMPMETSWCFGRYGRCQFRGVCDLPEHSRGVELESTNYINNTWSPLIKSSEKNS